MKIGEGPTRSAWPDPNEGGSFYPCAAPVGSRVSVPGIGTATTVPLEAPTTTCDWCKETYTLAAVEASGHGVFGHSCPACMVEGEAENHHSDEGHDGPLGDCGDCAPYVAEAAALRVKA